MESMYQKRETEMNEFIEGYKAIQSDMEENYQKIMTSVNFEPFQDIMNLYTSKF